MIYWKSWMTANWNLYAAKKCIKAGFTVSLLFCWKAKLKMIGNEYIHFVACTQNTYFMFHIYKWVFSYQYLWEHDEVLWAFCKCSPLSKTTSTEKEALASTISLRAPKTLALKYILLQLKFSISSQSVSCRGHLVAINIVNLIQFDYFAITVYHLWKINVITLFVLSYQNIHWFLR